MGLVCRHCSRVNPPEARFCYWDGANLAGVAGAQQAGAAPFAAPFVFPNGQACRTFDQLAQACCTQWPAAVGLLKQGYFTSFLSAMGRLDLAAAAQEAARFPDPERGLDQLLARLPTQTLQPPVLKVEPREFNLGQLPMGQDRSLSLRLRNAGMRLCYGTVVSDSKWLVLDGGQDQKLLQFAGEASLPVHIRGHLLRAGNKPLEGHLLIETNGGNLTIAVQADVPIKPFPLGMFQGALTPREVALKARSHPKQAAPLFEDGSVARWYASNGWPYPVQGPTVPGIGGVQQFFEALGLAKAPRVQLASPSLNLRGDGGAVLQAAIEVVTSEPKVVWAHATCDQPWVDVSRWKAGKTATITVSIPRVPNRPYQTITANILVTANGNQKFTVPLSLAVGAPSPFGDEMPVRNAPPVPGMPPIPAGPLRLPQAGAVAAPAVAPPPPPAGFIPTAAIPALPVPAVPVPAAPYPGTYPAPSNAAAGAASLPRPRRRRVWSHLAPLGLLLLVLIGLLLRDLIATAPQSAGPEIPIDETPRLAVLFDWGPPGSDLTNTLQFGVTTVVKEGENYRPDKPLTYNLYGRSNSAVARIDDREALVGAAAGGDGWDSTPPLPADLSSPVRLTGRDEKTRGSKPLSTVWKFKENVTLTQTVQIVPGEPIPDDKDHDRIARRLDTVLVRYAFHNRDDRPHRVGLRVVIDTLIGSNDGTPFTIAGEKSLIDTSRALEGSAIPDFIQAQEFADPERPGTVVRIGLNLGKDLETPEKVLLTRWPGRADAGSRLRSWDVLLRDMTNKAAPPPDSALVLYWQARDLAPDARRVFGFTYGLGDITKGNIALSVGGAFHVGGKFSVIAQVRDHKEGSTASLKLPRGLKLVEGTETQSIPPVFRDIEGVRANPITWRVEAERDGLFTITVITSEGKEQRKQVKIGGAGIF